MTRFSYPAFEEEQLETFEVRNPERGDTYDHNKGVVVHSSRSGVTRSLLPLNAVGVSHKMQLVFILKKTEFELFLAFLLRAKSHYIRYTSHTGGVSNVTLADNQIRYNYIDRNETVKVDLTLERWF